jgi:hypothetical protein
MAHQGPKVTVKMQMTLRVTDPQALHDAAPPPNPTGEHTTFVEGGGQAPPGMLDRLDAEDASAVFRLWPQEAIRDLVKGVIPGVFIDGYSFGTLGQ